MIQKINKTTIQIIGFVSITSAWTAMNLLYAIYLVFVYGKAEDSGMVLFWSGLFVLIAWAVFLVYPLSKLDPSKLLFKPLVFIPVSTLYGVFAYSVLMATTFRIIALWKMFLPQATIIGLFFGLVCSLLLKSKSLVTAFQQHLVIKVISLFSPVIALGFFLWFLPLVAPSLVFRFMPDTIQENIIAKTIPKFQVGDTIESLKKALPGYVQHIQDSGNLAASMEDFAFVLQVQCGKIIRIEHGQSPFDIDNAIYGALNAKPCSSQD